MEVLEEEMAFENTIIFRFQPLVFGTVHKSQLVTTWIIFPGESSEMIILNLWACFFLDGEMSPTFFEKDQFFFFEFRSLPKSSRVFVWCLLYVFVMMEWSHPFFNQHLRFFKTVKETWGKNGEENSPSMPKSILTTIEKNTQQVYNSTSAKFDWFSKPASCVFLFHRQTCGLSRPSWWIALASQLCWMQWHDKAM